MKNFKMQLEKEFKTLVEKYKVKEKYIKIGISALVLSLVLSLKPINKFAEHLVSIKKQVVNSLAPLDDELINIFNVMTPDFNRRVSESFQKLQKRYPTNTLNKGTVPLLSDEDIKIACQKVIEMNPLKDNKESSFEFLVSQVVRKNNYNIDNVRVVMRSLLKDKKATSSFIKSDMESVFEDIVKNALPNEKLTPKKRVKPKTDAKKIKPIKKTKPVKKVKSS